MGDLVSSSFDGFDVRTESVLAGEITDQAGLHGLLARVRDFGLQLVDVKVSDGGPPDSE